MLSIEEIATLEEEMQALLPDKLTEILTRANIRGELEDLLRIMGLSDLIQEENTFETYKDGKIVVIGGSEVKEEVLLSIGKQLGIDKKRFEFCLDYKSVQKYDFRKMQRNTGSSCSDRHRIADTEKETAAALLPSLKNQMPIPEWNAC